MARGDVWFPTKFAVPYASWTQGSQLPVKDFAPKTFVYASHSRTQVRAFRWTGQLFRFVDGLCREPVRTPLRPAAHNMDTKIGFLLFQVLHLVYVYYYNMIVREALVFYTQIDDNLHFLFCFSCTLESLQGANAVVVYLGMRRSVRFGVLGGACCERERFIGPSESDGDSKQCTADPMEIQVKFESIWRFGLYCLK